MSPPDVSQLADTYKGLLFTSASEPPTVTSIPTPSLDPGSVIVRPIYSWIPSYANEIFANGNPRNYGVPFPVVGGSNAIGRVAAIPPDSTSLKVGDLVTVEPIIRPRDDPNSNIMLALNYGFSDQTKKVAHDVWRHGTMAELVRAPLENVHRFNEAALERQGVSIQDLGFFGQLAVAYGGLRDANLTAGETILISPATGNFGGAAVHLALAMGARVVAMGRNAAILSELKELAPGRVETVTMSGDVQSDAAAIAKVGPIDVFQDLTPTKATSTSHVQAGILSVRPRGRISLMGGVSELTIPYAVIVLRAITLKGTEMYTWEQAKDLIKMIETGALKLGEKAGLKTKGVFKLDDWDEAMRLSETEAGAGRGVFFAPNQE